MQRSKLGLVCLSWLLMASAVSAQTTGDPSNAPGVATLQNYSGSGVIDGTYISLRHQIGDGQGYQNSYSQIGLFTPFWLGENTIFAPNAQFIVTNSTQYGVNVGGVGRHYFDSIDRIFGIYGFYDNDQDTYSYRYTQYTAGAETLGRVFDGRINGYFVTGSNSNAIAPIGITGGPYYVGHAIGFNGAQWTDSAYSGGDAEIGAAVSPYANWCRAYAGAYAYQTGSGNTIGFRGRIEATVSSDLSLGVMVTQDPLWGTNVNGMIDFKFSGFLPTRYFPNYTTRERMLNPVFRNWRVSTHAGATNVIVDAINPRTGQPYFITHVDNSAPAGGDGTVEHPYQHLQTSTPADIILVHYGNATSPATAVTGSAVLPDFQRLLGTGILSQAPINLVYGSTNINNQLINLPLTSNSGLLPYVTNAAGSIVTLGNNNEVAGINFVNSGGTAIQNTVAGSNNFNLHDLGIANNAGFGINLLNASGSGAINNINLGTGPQPNPNGIGNNALGGIQVATGAAGLTLPITNVNMNSNPAGNQAFGISLIATNGPLSTTMTGVNTNGNTGAGIQMSETGQTLAATMTNVNSQGNGGVGVSVAGTGTGGNITLNTNNLQATGNTGDNLDIGTVAAPVTSALITANLQNSNFNGSTAGNGIVFSGSGSFGTLNLNNPAVTGFSPNVSGNKLDGLYINATGASLMNATVNNANFSGNGQNAFQVNSTGGSTVNLTVDPTNASGSGKNGLLFNIGALSTFNTTFTNDNLNNSGVSAVNGTMTNFANLTMNFTSTTGQNSGADGFILGATSNSVATINITNGTFQNSGLATPLSSAVNIASDNSSVTITTNNTLPAPPTLTNLSFGGNLSQTTGLVGSQAYGLNLNLTNNSIFNGNFNNADFKDNLTNGILANVASGANATLNVTNANTLNTSINNSGSDGYVATVNAATLNTTLTNATINNSGTSATATSGNGSNFNVTNGGTLNATFNASTMNNNGTAHPLTAAGDGLLIGVTGVGSNATINLTNVSNINGNSLSGINFNVNAGSLTVNDNTPATAAASISNNGAGSVLANGSGVLGVESNSGLATLNFTNIAVNNNFNNGIAVSTTTGANIIATLNGGTVNNNTNGDGIQLLMNNAVLAATPLVSSSFLNLSNGLVITGNGNNGVTIDAENGTKFSGTFLSTTINNNGVLGVAAPQAAGVYVTAGLVGPAPDKSSVSLTLGTSAATADAINNTAAGGTQQYGLLTSSANSASILTQATSANLSNNAIDAINSTVNSSSVTNIALTDTVADNSGGIGALFSVATGGQLYFQDTSSAAANTASISSSGAAGILTTVDGAGSVAAFNLNQLNLNFNGLTFGGQGFWGSASNGGQLNAAIQNSNITGNSNQGIEINATGAGTIARFNVQSTGANTMAINNNGSEGLLINATNTGTVYYRSITSQYEANGSNGGLDGIGINANNATVVSQFSGDTVTNNSGNGFNLNDSNGGIMTTSFLNETITNNSKYGIDVTVDNTATTQFNLLMNGTNTLTGNTLGSLSTLSFNGINQAVIQLSGTFSNPTGNGVDVEMTNVTNGAVAVLGPGTIDNSGGNGIYVTMNTVTNASLLVSGMTEINNSAGDGIYVDFNTVANGAIDIQGPTNINNSTGGPVVGKPGSPFPGDAVDIHLESTSLVNAPTIGTAPIQYVSLASSFTYTPPVGNPPPNGVYPALTNLPTPVVPATTLSSLVPAIIPTAALTIDSISATGSAGAGISVVGTNSTIAAPTVASPATTGTHITNNTIAGAAAGDGILVSLTNAASTHSADGMVISTNTISGANTNGIHLLLNNAPITGMTMNANKVGSAALPDKADGIRFDLTNSSLIGTLANPFTLSNNTIASNGSNGIDFTSPTNAVVNSDVTGITFLTNSITNNTGDGIRLVNPTTVTNAVALTFTTNTITGNTGDGVDLNLVTGAQNLNATFTGNTISSNTGGPGINMALAAAKTLTTSITGNTINSNNQQGIDIQTGAGGTITATTIDTNTINGNGSDGITIGMSTGGTFTDNSFFGNTIGTAASRNGGLGVNLNAPNGSTFTWKLGDSTKAANLISGNNGAGVGINMSGSAIGNLTVQNTTFSNTLTGANPNFNGQGLGIILNNTATLNNAVIGDSTVATNNTIFSGNAGAGLSILANAAAQVTPLTITNVNSTGNTGDGIDISRIGGATINNVTIQNSTVSTNAIGVSLLATNQLQTDNYTINNNTFTQNRSDGLRLNVRFDAAITANLTGNTITNNTGNGIDVIETANTGTDNRIVSGNWITNTITGNSQNGISISAQDNITIGDGTLAHQNLINSNGFNGILLQGVTDVSTSSTTINMNQINLNGSRGAGQFNTNGIWVNAVNTAVSISNDTISQNTNDGIQLLGNTGTFLNASINTTSILSNGLDGVAINSSGQMTGNTNGPGSSTSVVNVAIGASSTQANMVIFNNGGRGVNILNQNQGNANISVQNTTINNNGLEGFYIVNTPSPDNTLNSQVTFSNLAANGSAFDHSQMKLTISNDLVTNNGFSATGANVSDTGGLYMLVGTNGATTNPLNAGGFASTATDIGTSLATANLTGIGGVLALITGNTFQGSAGHDVTFRSFAAVNQSTLTSGTTWTDGNPTPPNPINPVFNANGYVADPLARLDLAFNTNTVQDALLTRSGASFNNADGVFKSRLNGPPATVSPGGPFNNASRLRNAQRLADNSAPFNAPTTPPTAAGNFLYPGVGGSTFRVTSSSLAGNGYGSNLFPFTSAVGLGGGVGELSFFWDTNLTP